MTNSSQYLVAVLASALTAGCGSDEGMMSGPLEQTPTAGAAGTPPMMGASGTGGMAGSGMQNAQAGTGAGTGASGTGGFAGAGGTGAAGSTGAPAAGTGGVGGGAGSAGAGGTGGMDAPAEGLLPRVETTDGPGPFGEVVKVKDTPPGGWLIYPKELGRDGTKHPIFLFGPGGGTTPQTYEQMGMHWDRYGSYGFVIYVLPQSTGDGEAMRAGLDWVIEQNDDPSSPLYQKVDVTRVAAAGHSMGSVTTFDFMPDERVTTTIHVSGGSFDGMGPSRLSKPTMFLCGEMGDPATPQCDQDFENSQVPTFYTIVKGSSHLTSGRLGWEAIIAWLLWHLADQEDQWKHEFVETTGKFHMGIYQSQVKNW